MSSNRRRAEIAQLISDGRVAHRTGKPRSAVPFKPFQSTNSDHWLRGWDMEEQARLDNEQLARDSEHARLVSGIAIFEQTGDRMTLVSVLRIIADRLPPVA